MPSYISLLNFTDQGIRTVIGDHPASRWCRRTRPAEVRVQLADLLDRGCLRCRLHPRSPRRRERHRLPLGRRLQGSRQDDYASRLRSGRDVRDHLQRLG